MNPHTQRDLLVMVTARELWQPAPLLPFSLPSPLLPFPLRDSPRIFIPSSLGMCYSFCLEHLSLPLEPSTTFHGRISAQRASLWEALLDILAAVTSGHRRDTPSVLLSTLGAALMCGLQLQTLCGQVWASIQLHLPLVLMHRLCSRC